MRPEQQNDKSGKSPYAFSNLMQTTILNIFSCCYHDAGDMSKFYANLRKVDKGILRSICQRGRNEKGSHGNDNETVPRQHSGSGNSIEIPVQRKCDGSVTCDRRWGAPGYRVPT